MPRPSSFQKLSTKQFGGLDTSDRLPGGSNCSRHIASGQFNDNGVDEDITVSRRYTTNTSDDYTGDDNNNCNTELDEKTTDINPYEGYIEEAITFPQSTHSWLFTEEIFSLPFAFAVGMVSLSYISLILALLNVFEEGEPGNPFGVPEQVPTSVRIAQYLAMIIALIMEEEIPTGLYLLRLITKKSLHNTFPRMKFSRFVAAAIVRLVMGYLFLFNTFCVVVQATAVLDIFFDVLALQFLQQLDDISFNLSKIDVFGRRMKKAALSKCFCAEFERQPFSKRKKVGIFLKGIYFLNLCALLFGMGYINYNQNRGVYYSDSLSVTYGEQIWNAAIINGIEEPRALLFSYFNGEYRRNETLGLHDGRPIYTERSKFVNGEPFTTTVGAQIKYCNSERAWVLAHDLIKKSDIEDESDCPWLLRSQETTEYNLLNVDGDWSIWTGNLQENGHFFAVDNECNGPADCNYHGVCNDGKCECSEEAGYYGIHCEHQKACRIIRGGKGEGGLWASVQWATDEMLIYQRPVYAYQGGLPAETLEAFNVDPDKDQVFLVYTGSRWLGVHFIGTKRNSPSRDFWRGYVQNFHAFWTNLYTTQTLFASDPTSKSSIIGIDFYSLGELGEEHGPYGELFPLSDPQGSGFFKCVDGEVEALAYEFSYLRHSYIKNRDEIVVEYEIKDGEKARGREYQFKELALDCSSPITGITLNPTHNRMIDKWPGWSQMNLIYNIDKSQLSNTTNIWNATTGMLSWCVAVQLIESNSTKVLMEELNIIRNVI